MTRIQTILHPTDFSEYAGHAFQFACALARDYGAKLIVLHVQPAPPIIAGEIPPPPQPPEELSLLWERLHALQPDDPRVAIEHHMRFGAEAAEIVGQARASACDLIVMGTHGRTGLSRMLMGSVAELVLRKAPCPVLTVKQPFAGAGPSGQPEMHPHMRMAVQTG